MLDKLKNEIMSVCGILGLYPNQIYLDRIIALARTSPDDVYKIIVSIANTTETSFTSRATYIRKVLSDERY